MSEHYVVASMDELSEVARGVVGKLRGGEVVLLYGELGAGKTTFVQAVARELDVVDAVTSPTFTIVGEYAIPGGGGLTTLVHVDLYRLDEAQVAREVSVREVLERAGETDRVTFVEWAERLDELAPAGAWQVRLAHGETAEERVVTIDYDS